MENWNKTRQDIGDRIELLRTKKGLTQAELAKAMTAILGKNISRETIKQWERGERDLKTEATVALSEFFETNCDYLLRGINAQNTGINATLGLSDGAINVLRTCNMVPSLKEIALPALDRLLCNEDIYEFLGSLNMAYQYSDNTMSSRIRDAAFNFSISPSLPDDEKEKFAAMYEDMKAEADGRDLWSYKVQRILGKIIEEAKG